MNKKILFDKINSYLLNKTVSDQNNYKFIKLIYDLNSYCFAFVQYKNNKLSVNLYGGTNSEQGQKFGLILKNKISSILNKINGKFHFFISLNDGINYPENISNYIKKHIIMLSAYSIIGREEIEFLIPDLYILTDNHRVGLIRSYKNNIPFFKRIPIAKFRGSQTGGLYNMEAVIANNLPRLKGAHMSLDYPFLLDIRFINSYNIQNTDGDKYINYMNNKFGPPFPLEPMENFNRNRYLLCFDGNESPPFARPEIIMISGSVPLFQTKFIKYWSIFLKDGINYIKINDDLTNLIDVIHYLNNNNKIALKIANNARQLALDVITPSFQDEYLIHILNSISNYINKK
jgi:hypothetical protein